MNGANSTSSGAAAKAVFGCAMLMLLPAALAAGVAYCGYAYFYSADEPEIPGQKNFGDHRSNPTAPAAPAGPAFTAAEERDIQALLKDLGSPDADVCANTWRRLTPYHKKNQALLRQRLSDALFRSNDRLFVYNTTWGLCTYYGDEGKAAVVQAALSWKNNPNLLHGIADAVSRMENRDEREDLTRALRTELEKANSLFVDLFPR
ncbi:MAG: hypothetical protein HY291_21345 [Planctomycetes bacterium]|nr:hypothetical protein [Planctomycetota bacterium]